MNTILAPIASDGIIAAWHPVTWNKGTTINELFCGALGSGGGKGSPRRRKPRAMPKGRTNTDVVQFRWVPSAPFGFPVVPDV